MKFNLARLNDDSKIVAHTDEQFIDTPLATEPFSIQITKLSRADRIDTMTKAVKEDGTLSNGEYSKALFVASISDVDGFVNENNEPLTLEDGVAEIIWELAPDILVETVKAGIQSFNEVEEKKSETLENDSAILPIGQ